VNGATDALVGSAAANVARERIVNIGIGGRGVFREERGSGHDHSRLAIAALRDLFLEPGCLSGVVAIGGKAFNGGDVAPGNRRYASDTRTRWFSIHMDGACSALRNTATELCAREAEGVAKDPEQRSVRADLDGMLLAVDGDGDCIHEFPPGVRKELYVGRRRKSIADCQVRAWRRGEHRRCRRKDIKRLAR
jgi:hypothetical protein